MTDSNIEELDVNIKIGDDPEDPKKKMSYSSNDVPQKPNLPLQNQPTAADQNDNSSFFDLRRSSHPVAGFFTVFFKAIAILGYLLLKPITDDEIITALVTILAAAFDFWTVKNVTGRLLVGLRWWSEIKEDGTEKWHFESYDTKVKLNTWDKRFFWGTQLIACIFWLVMAILKLISLSLFWTAVTTTCFLLSAINYYGHYKCSKEHQKKVNDLLKRTAFNAVTRGMTK